MKSKKLNSFRDNQLLQDLQVTQTFIMGNSQSIFRTLSTERLAHNEGRVQDIKPFQTQTVLVQPIVHVC